MRCRRLVGDLFAAPATSRVELGPGAVGDDRRAVGEDAARAVGAVGGERVERVGDREDACGDGGGLADQAVRVAAAVPALVV